MSGKNLFSIELEYLVAPKRVLKIQADHLSQLSDETIVARVETARGSQGMDDCFTHSFHIRVPKLSYNAQLFEVTHGIDMYPIQVRNDDWTFEQECPDAASFEAAVAEILNAPETKRRLEALRSQAFAEMEEQPSMEIEHASSFSVVDPISASTESPPEQTPVESESEPEPETQPEQEQVVAEQTNDLVEDPTTDEVNPNDQADSADVVESPGDDSEPMDADPDQSDDLVEEYFEEWGEPIEFSKANVGLAPTQPGAAIIYSKEGSPLFIAYAKNIQTALNRQLGRKASPVVSKAKKSGLFFICGTVRSIDEAEQIVESRINTMPFRALLGDSESNDWM